MAGPCVVVVNLKPAKMAGQTSNGMVLCASNADASQFELLRPPADAKVGERVRPQRSPAAAAAARRLRHGSSLS
jgi:tRNA-binding EMAP/Myf-like protein